MNFTYLLFFCVLGYMCALLGIVLGLHLLVSMFVDTKQVTYTCNNKLNEEKVIVQDDLYSELDDLSDSMFSEYSDDEVYYQTETNAVNEPISYIDVKKCINNENNIEVYRKKEDKAYAILQNKIKI